MLFFMIPINININDKNNKTIKRKPNEAKPVTLFTGLTTNLLIVSSKLSKDSKKLSSCSIELILS